MDRKLPHIEEQICARLRIMKNFIVSRTDSVPVAEDIYGHAVLKIWEKIRNGKFRDDGGSIDSFMMWCAIGSIGDYYRKEKRLNHFALNEYAHYHGIFARNSEREYEIAMENRLFIEKVISILSAVCRKILILFLFQNMKPYEIGETLDMPPGTVSGYLRGMRIKFGNHFCRTRVRKKGKLSKKSDYRMDYIMRKING